METADLKEKRNILPHNLVLKNRSTLQLSGVVDVENFNDQTITAYTNDDSLVITGENLHIKKLNLEQGELFLTGKISSLSYTGKGKNLNDKKSIFSKLFK